MESQFYDCLEEGHVFPDQSTSCVMCDFSYEEDDLVNYVAERIWLVENSTNGNGNHLWDEPDSISATYYDSAKQIVDHVTKSIR